MPKVQMEVEKENNVKAQWGSKGKIIITRGFLVKGAHE